MTSDVPLSIIDTHQHLWDLEELRLAWLNLEGKSDVAGLDRSFLMEEFLEAASGVGLAGTVYMEVNVVQEDQEREAEYVAALCRRTDNPMQAAVIGGWPHDPGFPEYIGRWATQDFVKGVRTVLHDPDRPAGMCLGESFLAGCRRLGELNLTFDLCMRPGELGDAARLVDGCPGTQFILDHCGNMPVGTRDAALRRVWESGIRELAARDNVACKISGIVVTADPSWQPSDLQEVVEFCLDAFGEDRICFGGDWPVCTLRASYRRWVDALEWIVRDRSPGFRRKLFHDNARRIYRL